MKKYKIGYTTGVYDMFHIGHGLVNSTLFFMSILVIYLPDDAIKTKYKVIQ